MAFMDAFPRSTGIIEAVAKDFFNSQVQMTILNQSEENEHTGKKEHVVFLVVQMMNKPKKRSQQTGSDNSADIEDRKVCGQFVFHSC